MEQITAAYCPSPLLTCQCVICADAGEHTACKARIVLSNACKLQVLSKYPLIVQNTQCYVAHNHYWMTMMLMSDFLLLVQSYKTLATTLLISLPAFSNVAILLFLVFYIYAYIGVKLLGNIQRSTALNEHSNFSSFPLALLTLFRVATGDNWSDIYQACSITPDQGCDPSKCDSCTCEYVAASVLRPATCWFVDCYISVT